MLSTFSLDLSDILDSVQAQVAFQVHRCIFSPWPHHTDITKCTSSKTPVSDYLFSPYSLPPLIPELFTEQTSQGYAFTSLKKCYHHFPLQFSLTSTAFILQTSSLSFFQMFFSHHLFPQNCHFLTASIDFDILSPSPPSRLTSWQPLFRDCASSVILACPRIAMRSSASSSLKLNNSIPLTTGNEGPYL